MDNKHLHAVTILDVICVANKKKQEISEELQAIADAFKSDLTGVNSETLSNLQKLMDDYYNAESKLLMMCAESKGELQTELALCIDSMRRYADELMSLLANTSSGEIPSAPVGSVTLTDTVTGKIYNVYVSNGTLYMKESEV